jgi:hypothetical protein
MNRLSIPQFWIRRWLLTIAFLSSVTLLVLLQQSHAADAVILPDGFTVEGKYQRESELIIDPFGQMVSVPKSNGFDLMEVGPKYVVFSLHSQKGGKLEKDLPRPQLQTYTTKLPPGGKIKLTGVQTGAIPDFNKQWRRTVIFKQDYGTNKVDQQIVSLDPVTMVLESSTFAWRSRYYTCESTPKQIRKLLGDHPATRDDGDKIDANRRLAIATFLKDIGIQDFARSPQQAGWFDAARKELQQLKKDVPAAWDKETTEKYEKLARQIEASEQSRSVDELEAAVNAGRYEAAWRFLEQFKLTSDDPNDTKRLAVLRAQVENRRGHSLQVKQLLQDCLNRLGGLNDALPYSALGGGPGLLFAPRPKLTNEQTTLLYAGGAVATEIHPDTVARIELFRDLAEQADRQRKQGKQPTIKDAELLAAAVSGWLKGKNGADPNVPNAVRTWTTREMILRYTREDIGNVRRKILDDYTKSGAVPNHDELGQIVTLLPPTQAENLQSMKGTLLSGESVNDVSGIYKRNTGPLLDAANGKDYFLRLPSEYQHGRPYPVLLALTTPTLSAEMLVAQLAPFADKHGYILAAPEWTSSFASKQTYDFTGSDHISAIACLQDLLKRFHVDPDRVFLFGIMEGANFAVDLGMARPDLFAGVVPMCPNLPTNIFREFWHNAQKLPMYTITGELSGAVPNVRVIQEKWMRAGFPSLFTIYRGRGAEWFRMEIPRCFEWMARKTRVRGVGSLRLGKPGFEPWQVIRSNDDRYYWVGVAPGAMRKDNFVSGLGGAVITPAQFRADIDSKGTIVIDQARGIRKLIIWLERDLIDWSKPVRININGTPALNYTPKVLTPDIQLMLEELTRTGDRRMLFLGRLELDVGGL